MEKKKRKTGSMKIEKNITLFTLENTAFHGYRVSKIFLGQSFCKYYSVKDFGSEKKALSAAKKGLAAFNKVIETATLKKGTLSAATVNEAKAALVVNPTGK